MPLPIRTAEDLARAPVVDDPIATLNLGAALRPLAGVARLDRADGAANAPLLATRTGRRQTLTNIDHRVKGAIEVANKRLAELGIEPLSERVTPYSLRRTYASLRAACGDDPVYIASQMGHEDLTFTLRVYQRAVKRRGKLSGNHLREFERALEWAAIGQQAHALPSEATMTNGAGVQDPASLSDNSAPGPVAQSVRAADS